MFQEYTYKKITPCDVCREILRGHARQGLKCKMCKINVHYGECQERAPKCQVSEKSGQKKINQLVCWCFFVRCDASEREKKEKKNWQVDASGLFFHPQSNANHFLPDTLICLLQPKQRLLRRQKSASELESRYGLPECDDEKSKYHSLNIIHKYLCDSLFFCISPALLAVI